eukprot:GHVN01033870.1.p1 GENE.GHVN01033870.1~~GHVN01033870.1.p1  ORF type:complete len:399 (+),score=58.57 GHVN01033870.1:1-1197(+)
MRRWQRRVRAIKTQTTKMRIFKPLPSFSTTRAGLRRPITTTPIRYGRLHPNILSTIGSTPVVKINKLAPPHVNLFVKLEFFNPLSSVKDRLALALIENAERRGDLKPGDTVVEGTSGNTGIALAFVCAQKGYAFVACMSETFSVERRKIMRSLGAKVILTPAMYGGYGMVAKAVELSKQPGWRLTQQFESQANADYHAQTTGPEILCDFSSTPLNYWVTGYGTGGTFAGAGRVLKAALPQVKIVLCEPELCPMIKSGVPQARHSDGTPKSAHPNFKPHPIQGWAPNFIPLVCQQGIDGGLADSVMLVSGGEAMTAAIQLGEKEGIFSGTSGGATLAVGLKIAETAPVGSNILVMIPDTQERYISTPLYDSIQADMNEEEIEISMSTPGFHLDPPEQQN